MQLMCDAIAVLGSRHGLLFNPIERHCGILRFDRFTRLPRVEIRAGMRIDGRDYVLPLCPDGERLDFYDQRMSPCSTSFIGVHGPSATRVKLTVVTPFRPRDGEFSTVPVLGLKVEAAPLGGQFRWTRREMNLTGATVFLEIRGPPIETHESGERTVDLLFDSIRGATYDGMADVWQAREEPVRQRDRLVLCGPGRRQAARFELDVEFRSAAPRPLVVAWCTFSEPVMEVRGERFPFKYAERFVGLDAVSAWAAENAAALFGNAANVDGIVGRNNACKSLNNLLAQTLHSWLINTWWCSKGGRDWFSVWEGACYFHSTVDVEYTQTPFYLAVWPDLLRYELDWWPEFSKSGATLLGERGRGTLYLSHDMGAHATANGQIYSHDMEVEEAANYVIMSYVYFRRTGDDSMLRKHAETLIAYLDFIAACDTTGDGVPNVGVANTIDDASPAIQFGAEQTYLAVKALSAMVAGREIAEGLGRREKAGVYRTQADKIRGTIKRTGWAGRHFNTLLVRSGKLKNPWTGQEQACAEIPGWNAPHIYTLNGIAPLDMVAASVDLPEGWLVRDLRTSTERCQREYGCAHTDFRNDATQSAPDAVGLVGLAANPGWISMNMLRDIAAFYRGVDLRHLIDRYWEWQTTTNSQGPAIFFETFQGNYLRFYPRGVAVWGYFEALAGLVIDLAGAREQRNPRFAQVRVPRLFDADWEHGTCDVLES